MNNYQMFRKIQERDNIIKKYSNDTREDLIDLVIEKDNIIDNLQFKIDKVIEWIEQYEKQIGTLGETSKSIVLTDDVVIGNLLDILKREVN